MINEYTYIVGMGFISWAIAIFMLFGFVCLMVCIEVARNEHINDLLRHASRMILEDFYSRRFDGKVIFLIQNGAVLTSLMFTNAFDALKKWVKKG